MPVSTTRSERSLGASQSQCSCALVCHPCSSSRLAKCSRPGQEVGALRTAPSLVPWSPGISGQCCPPVSVWLVVCAGPLSTIEPVTGLPTSPPETVQLCSGHLAPTVSPGHPEAALQLAQARSCNGWQGWPCWTVVVSWGSLPTAHTPGPRLSSVNGLISLHNNSVTASIPKL